MVGFTLSVNFVSGLSLFESDTPFGFQIHDETNRTFNATTDIPVQDGESGIDALWIVVLSGTSIAGLALAWITRSPVVLGIYVFSVVFWAAYGNTLIILDVGNWIPAGFLAIATGLMAFFYAGAIAGMLSGSG